MAQNSMSEGSVTAPKTHANTGLVRPKIYPAFDEVLEPGIRDAALSHWGVEVADAYSTVELGTIAHQCPANENLHVQSESILPEVLGDDGTPCLPGEVGRVVITALHNFATPLIRYELGDYAEVGEACPCVDYQFVYVDDIPRGANGKFEEFKSEVL